MIYRIRSYHGGLGDELQFSTFPRALKEFNKENQTCLFVENDPKDILPIRNPGIAKLVWGDNPYVHGQSDLGEWNLGDLPGIKYENKTGDFIKNWEVAFDLEPKNSLPEIYYKPLKVAGFEIVIELSSISLKYNPAKVVEAVEHILVKHGWSIENNNVLQLVTSHQSNAITVPYVQPFELKGQDSYASLCQLSNVIYNCKVFISLSSGSHSLAAAIRRQNPDFKHFCILPHTDYDWIMESRKFVYPGIEYLKESA